MSIFKIFGDKRAEHSPAFTSNWLYSGAAMYDPGCWEGLGTAEPTDADPVKIGEQLQALRECGIYDPLVMRDGDSRRIAQTTAARVIREMMEQNCVQFEGGDEPITDAFVG